ncbi:hypothetical protein QQ045_030830 [Rhodiola kirilowii]
MHFSSYKSSNPMENEMCSNVPPDRAEMLDDDATSLRISGSYVDHFPSGYDLSNQNQIISEQPVFSALQGEPICDLLAGAHISNQPVYLGSDAFVSRGAQSHRIGDATLVGSTWLDGETVCEEHIAEGTLVPATMLASLLASRGCVYRNVDDSALCNPSVPFDRSYNSNQMHAGMADEWVQPSTVFHGISVSHSAEQGYYFDSWISNRKANLATDYQYGTAMFNNELSPSPSGLYQSSIHEQCSELGPSGITNHYDSGRASEQSSSTKNNDRSLTYASRGKSQSTAASSSSSYLRAVQQILADLSSFSLENVDYGSYSRCSPSNVASVSGEYLESDGNESSQGASFSLQRQEVSAKKKQLKALLKMVDEGYNQCVRDVHNVISAFHPITGLEPEVSARFVLQTTSCLYKSLKEKISAQIFNKKANIQSDSSTERERAFESSFIHKQWALQQLRRKEHQLWRPQRGLPERSVSVLRAWMFQNFLHPYPKDSDKHMLAIKSGLTRSQVSNWFINARVRLWKPMIEEMYAEINRRKTHQKTHLGENSVSLLLGKSTIPM